MTSPRAPDADRADGPATARRVEITAAGLPMVNAGWQDVTLMSDEVITSIPVTESGAPLVDTARAVPFTGETPDARWLRQPVPRGSTQRRR